MIGEFLKLSFAGLSHVFEMAGQIISKPEKDASSSEATTKSSSLSPKGTTHPSRVQPHPSSASKTHTKQTTGKKYRDLPIYTKQLMQKTKPNDAQRKRDVETEVAQKKARVIDPVASEGIVATHTFTRTFTI